jgi:hypothetical protein
MIVVSDTSCISNLLTIEHAHLLVALFGQVIIPPAVESELLRFHPVLPDFLKPVSPLNMAMVTRLGTELDAGEAEAICVAFVIAPLLLFALVLASPYFSARLSLLVSGYPFARIAPKQGLDIFKFVATDNFACQAIVFSKDRAVGWICRPVGYGFANEQFHTFSALGGSENPEAAVARKQSLPRALTSRAYSTCGFCRMDFPA